VTRMLRLLLSTPIPRFARDPPLLIFVLLMTVNEEDCIRNAHAASVSSHLSYLNTSDTILFVFIH
jgi:hypothetical protein